MIIIPNIEAIGYNEEVEEKIIEIIFSTMKKEFPGNIDDTVITFVKAKVLDQNGIQRPYLRVLHTNKEEGEKIAIALSTLFEVEALFLDNYFPAKK